MTSTLSSPRKIFAIGDIHGCFDRLRRLMEILPYDRERDLLIFLGDYIDRGAKSREVISYLCELRRNGAHLVTLMGNHEYLLEEYRQRPDPGMIPLLRKLQVELTLASYGLRDMSRLYQLAGLPEEHRRFFSELLPYYETDTHIFVHGGLYPGIPVEQQGPESLTEIRDVFLFSHHDFGKTVVFGHTPFLTPLVTRTKIGIDTGAVYGNMLTAVELPARVFYHA
ncbi:MAG: metallophosphoesterase family protein [Desulfobulbaceae bacterium]